MTIMGLLNLWGTAQLNTRKSRRDCSDNVACITNQFLANLARPPHPSSLTSSVPGSAEVVRCQQVTGETTGRYQLHHIRRKRNNFAAAADAAVAVTPLAANWLAGATVRPYRRSAYPTTSLLCYLSAASAGCFYTCKKAFTHC